MLFSIVCWLALGVCWHVVVAMIRGDSITAVMSWEMVGGAAAGLAAGFFTIWSRRRRAGRESFGSVLATYYLAMVVYWLSLTCLDVCLQLLRRGALRQSYWSRLPDDFLVWVVYGTMYGVVLIPLCWLTRHFVWLLHVRILPDSTKLPNGSSGSRS